MKLQLLIVLALLTGVSLAQSVPPPKATPVHPDEATSPAPKPAKKKPLQTAAQLQAALDQLTQSNRELLDLLKRQQAVLEDIQFDRRLQSRQIQSLEVRLSDTLMENTQLQKQVAALEATLSLGKSAAPIPQSSTIVVQPIITPGPKAAPPTAVEPPPPPPPASYLPAPSPDGPPGTKSFHRLFVLKGTDVKQTDVFHIDGRTWRVVWHNQDKDGKIYANTSALFINAFPRDDTIPQKVCSKLGSGGDTTDLEGPGNYYLKIEASGGSWEVAVEDFR